MKRDVLVYISGPMTAKDGRTIEQNTADGVALFVDLLKRGIPAFCPHLCGGFPSAWFELSHHEWIDYDYRVLDRCTHILMMERWHTSTGARLEYEYAVAHAIPMAFSLDQLEELLTVTVTLL